MMGLMAEPLFPSRAEAMQVETGRIEAELTRDFGAWMTSEQRRIYGLCHRMLQDPDEADSATQDVFLKAYQALQKEDAKALDDPGRWLSRIAVNTCLDRLRSRKWQFWRRRPQPADEATILGMARSKAPEGEQRYLAAQIGARVDAALLRLSDRQRAVFTLRHYDEMSLEEIGETLGLDVGTVKAHMFRAVGKLRKELRDLYEDGGKTVATTK
jgi:RNA polymerase sigma-70 factor, ECF subfamily